MRGDADQLSFEAILAPGQPLAVVPQVQLDGAPAKAVNGDGGSRRCLECGEPFSSPARAAEFCCAACRRGWNNRRATRGAELFDLYMAHRFDRAEAARAHVMTLMNRLVSDWRHEDHARRNGRRSWQRLANVLDRNPCLRAFTLHGTRKTGSRHRHEPKSAGSPTPHEGKRGV